MTDIAMSAGCHLPRGAWESWRPPSCSTSSAAMRRLGHGCHHVAIDDGFGNATVRVAVSPGPSPSHDNDWTVCLRNDLARDRATENLEDPRSAACPDDNVVDLMSVSIIHDRICYVVSI